MVEEKEIWNFRHENSHNPYTWTMAKLLLLLRTLVVYASMF